MSVSGQTWSGWCGPKMKIYLLNGINDSIATTTGLLVPHFRAAGYDVQHLYRPTSRSWFSRSKTYLETTADHLLLQLGNKDGKTCMVAHSQGCLQTYHMMRRSVGMPFDYLVFISPAMNRKGWRWERLPFTKMLVDYNPDDLAIWAGGILPLHPFGLAGCMGFKTTDPRIVQKSDSTLSDGFLGHNHYFHGETARDTADMVDRFLGGPRFPNDVS